MRSSSPVHLARVSRLLRLTATLAASSALVGLYACGGGSDDDDDSGKDGGASSDGGASKDGTVPGSDAAPATDAGSGDGSTPPADGGAPSDASHATDGGGGDGGDGGTVGQLGSCGAPFILDTSPNATPLGLTVSSFGGKWAVTWVQNGFPGDGRLRYFDGTALQPEIDLGQESAQPAHSAVDSSGLAYMIGAATTSVWRNIFDLVAGQNVATSSAAITSAVDPTGDPIASLPHGALAVYPTASTTEAAALSSGTGWGDAGSYAVAGETEFNHVALNAAGKGGASWAVPMKDSSLLLYVAAFDGANLGTPVTRAFPAATDGAGGYFNSAALSNGDLAFVWSTASDKGVTFSTFHTGTGTWDADMALDTFTSAVVDTIPQIFADADDDLTVVWTRPSGQESEPLVAVRRLAGTWGSIQSLGFSSAPARAAIDPNGNVVVAVTTTGSALTRVAAKGTTFDPPILTGLPQVSEAPALGFAFSATGDPIVVDFGAFDGGTHVVAVNCVTRP